MLRYALFIVDGVCIFFFQAEDGIRDLTVTGVQTCALPISNFANLVLAPQIIGWLSDWFAASFGAGSESLRWALLLLAPTGFWAAWHLWTSGATIRADEARAS